MARQGRYGIYKAIILKQPTVSTQNYTLTAESGSFTLTGNDVNLLVGRTLTADAGTFTLTGQDVNLLVGRVLTAETGQFTLTGNDANLVYTPFTPPRPTEQSGDGMEGYHRRRRLEKERKLEEEKRVREKEEENLVFNFIKIFTEQCL